MASYAIDSNRQPLVGTGIVEPVMRWVEDTATGRRKQSTDQDRDEAGTPLWAVEVSYLSEAFGRQTTVVGRVTVPAHSQPQVGRFETVGFDGLSVAVSVVKASGALREFWSANGIKAEARKAAA